jgi:hypothetical protein
MREGASASVRKGYLRINLLLVPVVQLAQGASSMILKVLWLLPYPNKAAYATPRGWRKHGSAGCWICPVALCRDIFAQESFCFINLLVGLSASGTVRAAGIL